MQIAIYCNYSLYTKWGLIDISNFLNEYSNESGDNMKNEKKNQLNSIWKKVISLMAVNERFQARTKKQTDLSAKMFGSKWWKIAN